VSKFKAIFDQHEEIKPVEVKQSKNRGKRSNPDYEQVSAYIRKNTYRDVKIALLQQAENKDFSDLVEELLAKWLSNQ
jgi:hypothetical protein